MLRNRAAMSAGSYVRDTNHEPIAIMLTQEESYFNDRRCVTIGAASH